jgi:hypothetical protein
VVRPERDDPAAPVELVRIGDDRISEGTDRRGLKLTEAFLGARSPGRTELPPGIEPILTRP